MIKEYIKYLKNNPEKYWFKAKLYGWGWTPVRWQGWVVILVFIGLILLNSHRVDSNINSASYTLINFIPQTVVLVLILLIICWVTGERPRWQWGPKDKGRKP